MERVYEPIAKNVSIYADLYEVYKAIPYALFPRTFILRSVVW